MTTNQLAPISTIFDGQPYEHTREVKEPALLNQLELLTNFHIGACEEYRRVVETIFGRPSTYSDLASLPWLPVRLFKRHELKSVPTSDVVRTLISSGTSGQAVSRIFLDRDTAASMTKALVRITGDFFGKKRLPMLIIDDDSFLKDRSKFNARAAGILGFSSLGRDHLYLLNSQLEPAWEALTQYLNKHQSTPILLFGFTFIVWQQFIQRAKAAGISVRFPAGSILIHGGGWKKLVDRQVSNEKFKAELAQVFGISRVHNYYGMVEQVGSIFMECEHGALHTPEYSDVIIRDPISLVPIADGQQGLIQVLSLLPRSYPGHSLLTEDLGTVHGEDDCPCGRPGKHFSVAGRLPNVEIRGCSDTRVTPST